MPSSALYYPTIDIHDPAWLRSALLFWEDIRTIVPRSIEKPYRTPDTEVCAAEGHLLPLHCEDHPEVIEALGLRAQELLQTRSLPISMSERMAEAEPNLPEIFDASRAGTRAKFHSGKFHAARLHPSKVSAELRHVFEHVKNTGESDWLLVDPSFGDIYMPALALLMAEASGNIVPVTNDPIEHGAALISLLADTPGVEAVQDGALVSLTMKNICIDPDAKIGDILKFKAKRRHQLLELQDELASLRTEIERADDVQQIHERAKEVYKRKIERGLEALSSELRAASIQSTWEGLYRGVFFTVPAQSLLGGVGHLIPGAIGAATHGIMIGTGALLTVTDVAVKNHFARRKARNGSPFTYLLDAHRKFSLPDKLSAMRLVQRMQQSFEQ